MAGNEGKAERRARPGLCLWLAAAIALGPVGSTRAYAGAGVRAGDASSPVAGTARAESAGLPAASGDPSPRAIGGHDAAPTGAADTTSPTIIPGGVPGMRTPTPAPAVPLALRALIAPAAIRMDNGGEQLAVRLSLLDAAGHPVAGRRVALTSSASFIDPGPAAITGPTGTAEFSIAVRAAFRHSAVAEGPVTIGAIDLGDGVTLGATARIAIYNRVAVLLAGAGSGLSCTIADCHDRIFASVSADVLAPLGLNLNGDGTHRTVLEYSYRGGAMVDARGGAQWLIARYTPCDTIQDPSPSVRALRAMLQRYRAAYPYTTFELIGHSLGGLMALDGLAGDGGASLRALAPATVDAVVTVDAPVNGLVSNAPTTLLSVIGGAAYLRGCPGQWFGAALLAHLFDLGRHAPQRQERWVRTLRDLGVRVLTMTNRDDQVVPEPLAIIDDGRARHVSDRARYAVGHAPWDGHGTLLSRTVGGRPNPAWADEVRMLRAYLGGLCTATTPVRADCPYPSIDTGF